MDFLKLIRYKNLFMVLLTLILTKYFLLDSIVPNNNFSILYFVIFSLSVLFISAFGYVINDYFDLKTDLINKPTKVYVTKIISKKDAFKISLILAIIGLTLGSVVSYLMLKTKLVSIYIFVIVSLYFYSNYLKKIAVLGNLLVAILCALPIFLLFLFIIDDNYIIYQNIFFCYPILIYLLFAIGITFIRELIKDIEDVNGDLKIKAKTLPIIIGRKRAANIAFFFSFLLLVICIRGLLVLQKNTVILLYSIIFIILPLLFFLYKLWSAKSKKDFTLLSNLLKIILFFGILSMLFFY
jgi:4-hydroxybenzoate polyprenyltransferase